jgi:hypothetical protein
MHPHALVDIGYVHTFILSLISRLVPYLIFPEGGGRDRAGKIHSSVLEAQCHN